MFWVETKWIRYIPPHSGRFQGRYSFIEKYHLGDWSPEIKTSQTPITELIFFNEGIFYSLVQTIFLRELLLQTDCCKAIDVTFDSIVYSSWSCGQKHSSWRGKYAKNRRLWPCERHPPGRLLQKNNRRECERVKKYLFSTLSFSEVHFQSGRTVRKTCGDYMERWKGWPTRMNTSNAWKDKTMGNENFETLKTWDYLQFDFKCTIILLNAEQ